MASVRHALLDIGTNTVLLLIADVEAMEHPIFSSRIKNIVADELFFVRLGEGMHQNRFFLPAAMERARKAFHEVQRICHRHGVSKIHGVATSAARDAKNAAAFFETIQQELHIPIEVISGELEAKYSFYGGLLTDQDPQSTAMVDIGGGSTELAFLSADHSLQARSMDIGSVRLLEMHALVFQENRWNELELLAKELMEGWKNFPPAFARALREKTWTAIAGTPTTLAGLCLGLSAFDPGKVNGFYLEKKKIIEQLKKISSWTALERLSHPLLGKARADILIPGSLILWSLLEMHGQSGCFVSAQGLRYGWMRFR